MSTSTEKRIARGDVGIYVDVKPHIRERIQFLQEVRGMTRAELIADLVEQETRRIASLARIVNSDVDQNTPYQPELVITTEWLHW